MILRTLASSSGGNCVLIQSGGTNVLLDAGISCRKITQRLRECGLTPGDLSGILVTHEHTDHVAGLSVLLRRRHIPVYASEGTCNALAFRQPDVARHLMVAPAGSYFQMGGLTVTSFPTSHDAAQSVGYTVSDGTHTAALVTDLGEVTDYVEQVVSGSHLVLLEANHDVGMVRNGPYPRHLQERILGRKGHLCNEAAADFALWLARRGTGRFVLSHLSQDNNRPELARAAVEGALEREGLKAQVCLAPRDALSAVFAL